MNEEYIQEIMRNNVRVYRNKMKLRQKDMAAIMGFEGIDRICHWERGRAVPGLINAIRLCMLLKVDLQELYPELYARISEEIRSQEIDHLFLFKK